MLEGNPDETPSTSGMVAEHFDRGPIWVLKIRRQGFLVIREAGLSIFTDEQVLFEDLDNKTCDLGGGICPSKASFPSSSAS